MAEPSSTLAAARASSPLRRCCWVPGRPQERISILRRWRRHATTPSATSWRTSAWLSICPSRCPRIPPQLATLVKPGGLLALSGILAEQAEDILAAYRADFELDPVAEREGWIRVSGKRRLAA